MARLSRRFSRYFSISRRCTQQMPPPSTSPRIDKAQISKPILSERDTHVLLSSHAYTHAHSSSQYTISDADLRALEEEKMSRRLEDAIDDILASYQGTSTPPCAPAKHNDTTTSTPVQTNTPTNPFVDPSPRASANATQADSSPTPSSSSIYSSPPPSPPTISATLDRFRDTPPPAPGWEKTDFGRQTRLFGPEGFVEFEGGGQGQGMGRTHEVEHGMVRGRKDWRGEFGRRGYAVL